jgi:phospholipid transport system substrate-binding protein
MRWISSLGLAALLPGLALRAPAASAAGVADAVVVIERLQAALVEVAEIEPDLNLAARYDRLAPVVLETHDLATMARLTVRRFWREWSEEDRAAFTDVFVRLSITTYASRFAAVGPDTLAVLGGSEDGAERVEVNALVRRTAAEDVPMDYLLQLEDGQWRIINVFADGASELSLMAAEYYDIIESRGFDALLATLEDKIAAL